MPAAALQPPRRKESLMRGDDPYLESLDAFLARHAPQAEALVEWPQSILRLRSFLCEALPPPELITSVRCVVLLGDAVLALRNAHETHILPGGRRENGETLEETARREVLEEAGWSLGALRLLGVRHFEHLTPRPPGHAFPFPHFCQAVYGALALEQIAGARLADDYEAEARPVPLRDARSLPLTPDQLVFLEAAARAVYG
jgi:ADP-ribose pyrophosphatase YjhB (NUDIX family)